MIRHLKLLAYLRWKYLWRAGGRSRRVGAALAVFVSIAISAGLFFWLQRVLTWHFNGPDLDRTWELVHLAFAVIYVIWLYTGSFNDLYDPGRLAPFPLAPRTLFLGSTLSSFIGLAAIFGGSLLAGFAIGVPGSAGEKLMRAGLFLFLLVHLQMVSRLSRLTFLAILTSRRWRDAAVLISTMIGGGLYLFLQMIPSDSKDKAFLAIMRFAESGGPSHWFAWCPAVWLSWAYQLEGLRSLAGFGAFATLTVLIYHAGGWVERRLAFSEPVFHYRPKRSAAKIPVRFLKGMSRAILTLAGPVAAAIARKEFAIFFRDPAIRHRVLSSVFYILVPFTVLFVVRTQGPPIEIEMGGFFLIFAEMFFLTNLFGVEGAGVRNLLWFPASRRHVFFGKNLAYLALFAPFNFAVLAVIASLTGSMDRIAMGLAYHLAALVIVMALGNVTSVYFPFPFLAPGQRMTRRDENGCLIVAARGLLYLLTFILFAPVLAASLVLQQPPWTVAAALLGLAYSAGVYAFALKLAERALLEREEALGDYFRAA